MDDMWADDLVNSLAASKDVKLVVLMVVKMVERKVGQRGNSKDEWKAQISVVMWEISKAIGTDD